MLGSNLGHYTPLRPRVSPAPWPAWVGSTGESSEAEGYNKTKLRANYNFRTNIPLEQSKSGEKISVGNLGDRPRKSAKI